MCSKKKPNGCRTVSRVQKAIRRSGSTLKEFFRRALQGTDFAVNDAVDNFQRFLRHGANAYPHYEIPGPVITLTDEILEKRIGRPLNRKSTSETSYRSSSGR